MSIKVKTQPRDSLIIIEVHPPIDIQVDPHEATDRTLEFQKQMNRHICRITDYTRVHLTFSDVVAGMAADKAFSNPYVHSIIVGTDELVKLAATSFKNDQYGNVDVKIVATIDEALVEAKRLLQPG